MASSLNHEGFLEYASKRMIRYAHSEKFMRWVCRYLILHLRPTQVSVALYDATLQSFCIQVSEGHPKVPSRLISLNTNSPLIQWFLNRGEASHIRRSRRVVTSSCMAQKEGPREHEIYEELVRHHVEACVRIETRERLAGYLLIGPRETQQPYSKEDLTFFQILANDIGIEIEKEEYLHHARHDPITGLYNRATLQETLGAIFEKERHNDFAAAMIDIDHFKSVNDRYGHLAGDQVIRCVADFIRSGIRKTDTAFRYGGEEFLVLFKKNARNPDRIISDDEFQNDIILAADRLRQKVNARPVTCLQYEIPLTISIGLTFLTPQTRSTASLIAEADRALYQAKNGGRNRVVVFAESESRQLISRRSL
ncbi:MAG TPA: sensor domain-containing diguanylate cyclase [Verrucomicrobiae bacterium]|nr:sensor domain-containing diguanylate cyclase [Verrucomicrobiae bacterium]